MEKLNILVTGSTGYIGTELIKLLVKHRGVNIKYLCGHSSIGKSITLYDKKLKNKKLPKIIKFNEKLLNHVDVIFSALPNGEAQKISNKLKINNTLIDLSADFRLKNAKLYSKYYKIKHSSVKNIKKSIYGLPEIKNKKIKKFNIIGCPGCYPTSILIPLIPLLKNNLISNKGIIIDSKSGYSGAGRAVHKKYKNKNLYESLSVYGIKNHRHNSEIQQELNFESGKNVEFTFTPHLAPMFRGILSTIYVKTKKRKNIKSVINTLKKYYKNQIFVNISKKNSLISTNDVINTNKCLLSVCESKTKNKLIILSAIDNLIKGGGGQAIQNFNILFNFKKNMGLK
tara:strand:- start:10375 stop:11397 length:1023 start_codon:yes stop_codon:yes gene_type:complete